MVQWEADERTLLAAVAKASNKTGYFGVYEAAARVNERLERARKHNKQVARQAAASTTVGRRVRGHLTRLRLRRERQAAPNGGDAARDGESVG